MMPMGGEMPPMDASAEMPEGNAMPPMDDNLTGDEGQNQFPSDFDSNFDAGVEADEETDPKKYIQQLTGKLSQSLNSYNNDNGEPDTELGKYVLGMLVKQGTKGMNDKDRKEIIKKINTNDSEGDNLPEDEMPEEDGMDMTPPEDEAANMDNMPQMESKVFNFTKSQIFESFGLAVDDNQSTKVDKGPDTKITPDTKRGRRTKPFEAPKKFKE